MKVQAHQLFFPAAALYAAIAPWFLLAYLASGKPQVVSSAVHARGLLFGYVGALIAGYLLGRTRLPMLMLLFSLWLAGRLLELSHADTLPASLLYALFGLLLAALVTPKFRAAKKWRNRVAGPLIALVTCYPLLDQALRIHGITPRIAIQGVILPLALLLLFMGGRIITPALAVAYAARGERLPQRVQPAIEGMTITLLLLASATYLLAPQSRWPGIPVVVAGTLVLLRLYRWKLFALNWRSADIWALGAGYCWLGLGLLAVGCDAGRPVAGWTSVHVITIGALGTLSCTVMLRLGCKRRPAAAGWYCAIYLLLALAVTGRVLADWMPGAREMLLAFTATLWSLNFVAVGWLLTVRAGH